MAFDRENPGQLPFELERSAEYELEQKVLRNRLCELVRNKCIIVTGPADYVVGRGKADWIESYDLVVRINFQWPVPLHLATDLGSRMDLLYHCCNGDYPLENLFYDDFEKTRFVCVEQNILSLKLKNYCQRKEIPCLYVTEMVRQLSLSLGCPPSTGLTAIVHLLSLPVRELQVYGMTLWASTYYPGYQGDGALDKNWSDQKLPVKIWQHSPKRERKYLRRLLKENRRLHFDTEALKIMNINPPHTTSYFRFNKDKTAAGF